MFDETQEKIIQATMNLIMEKGYGGTTTKDIGKCSIISTLTNVRPLTWPAVLVSPVCEFCLAASVTMEADLPEMTGRFDPDILEAQ